MAIVALNSVWVLPHVLVLIPLLAFSHGRFGCLPTAVSIGVQWELSLAIGRVAHYDVQYKQGVHLNNIIVISER